MQYDTEDRTSAGEGSPSTNRPPLRAVKPFSSRAGVIRRGAAGLLFFYAGWFLGAAVHPDWPLLAWCLFLAGVAGGVVLWAGPGQSWRLVPALAGVKRRVEQVGQMVVERGIHRKAAAVVTMLLVALHLRVCIIERVLVEGQSMIPRLSAGETFWMEKLSTGLRLPALGFPFPNLWHDLFPANKFPRYGLGGLDRGDIVVFQYPGISRRNERFIKRVIGLPGDLYEIREGRVWINDQLLPEPYLPPGIATAPVPRVPQPPVQEVPPVLALLAPEVAYSAMNGCEKKGLVPPHTVYVLGDNRAYSRDSRSFGFIPIFFIEGVALRVHLKTASMQF